MPHITGRIAHESGIPLGGLGTGSIEVRPDGYFHEWQIFNLGAWAPRQPECCKTPPPEIPPAALGFFIRTQQGKSPPLLRRLGLRCDQHDLYNLAWLKSVEEIRFAGRFPLAELEYVDAELPVAVSARMHSPFIPHDARASGTPGFYASFRVKNLTDQPVRVALLGLLKNPLAWGEPDRKLANSISRCQDAVLLTMRTRARPACLATVGSMSLSAAGGAVSWVTGESSRYCRFIHTWHPKGYGNRCESVMHEFRRAGRLPSLRADRSPVALMPPTAEGIRAMTPGERKRLIANLLQHPFVHALRGQVLPLDRKALQTDAGRATFLEEVRIRMERMYGKELKEQAWGDGALAAEQTLAPGEEREVRFALAWHFPHHYSQKGPDMGHMYDNWFRDAEAVNRYLVANRADFSRRTVAFAETLHDTSLPPEFADAWAGQLTTLVKCTWWPKSGEFAVWEGLGCCGFHTTDITYQGSFNILALFPELQKRQMRMGARFQREDGRVHHFFTPDLTAVDQGFDRVDMNPQFVLLACRDYLWTGDKGYLKRLWPHIVRAMDNSALLDGDHDGLPDHDTQRNTYDAWNFFGTPSYIASLWLGGLRAAIRIAEELGDKRRAAQWRRTLGKGLASFEKKLWNGEYYSLWVDGKRRDECCMTDQMSGEWFTQVSGLGHTLPRERIDAALKAIMKCNFSTEDGLMNATYPPKRQPLFSTFGNIQAVAPWTGIEYAFASLLLEFGHFAAARAIVRNIHERHMRAGRFWNHVECGDHYYRAMSSWAVLLSATGFKVDAPRESVTFAPAVEGELRAPWVSSTGWGIFERGAHGFRLCVREGSLRFRELRLGTDTHCGRMQWAVCPRPRVELNGRSLAARVGRKERVCVLAMPKLVCVRAGDEVSVHDGE